MVDIFRLPECIAQDVEDFKNEVERFKSGEQSFAKFRAFRVPQGVYEQREEGSFMLRVRLPGGVLLPHQMRALAAVSKKYAGGVPHVTTRQDIQLHSVPLDNIHPALAELYPAGLSTKGGGGNTVRNITACFDAGVCTREAFDVTPHAAALTEFLLPDPLSFQLPRKYKIAFAGCPSDCAGATVNDLGLIAKERDGEHGFAVYVGGGMGARSRVAQKFEDFVPAGDIFFVAEAIKRVFDKHGNRKNKHRARLRFLIEEIGLDGFRELYEGELAKLREAAPAVPQVRPLAAPEITPAASGESTDSFREWRKKNVVEQKQSGHYLVHIPLTLGDIEAENLAALADVVEETGERMLRTTQSQNLVIRWVGANELAQLYRKLAELDLADTPAPIVRNTIACAGASTCKLGICLSRGLARGIVDEVSRDGLDLDGFGEFGIHVSGCPNACGRHPIGRIGLFGAARRVGGDLVPHYVFQMGGVLKEGGTALAKGNETVPARNVPVFVADFLRAFQASPEHPDFDAFCRERGAEVAAELVEKYRRVPSFDEDKNFYFDWDARVPFSLAGRGPGECGAGVFDLIEVDIASAREALGDGRTFAAAALASRALLVTQGLEAKDDVAALDLFAQHFVEKGLLEDRSLHALIEKAQASAGASDPQGDFDAGAGEVSRLIESVQDLYDSMDPSLRFKGQGEAASAAAKSEAGGAPTQADVEVDREADLHGVACPLNYVKTKLALDQIASGQVLAVLLDDEGARNVPDSAKADGHTVLSVTQESGHWRVVLRKG